MEKTRKKQKIKACAAVNTAAKGVVSSAKKSKMTASEAGEVVKFNEADMPQLDVWLEDETIWLTQKQMGLLFGCAPQNITYHLREIYRIGELEMPSTCKEFLQVQIEGGRHDRSRAFH